MITAYNLATGGVSEYSLNLIDVVTLGEDVYGLNSLQLVSLTNETAGVAGQFKTGKLVLNDGFKYSLVGVLPLVRADADVLVTVSAQYDGVETEYGPFIATVNADEFREYYVRIGRGLRGTSYSVKLSCSGQWACQGVKLYIVRHSRLLQRQKQ
jgi:hypothetical protein